jgi:hypothetical protein
MVKEELDKILWKEPWYYDLSGLEGELAREVSPRHPLAGIEAIAIARRGDNDDVLFFLPNHDPPLAIVHLTWHYESGATWPRVAFCSSAEEFSTVHMKRDHEEYLECESE